MNGNWKGRGGKEFLPRPFLKKRDVRPYGSNQFLLEKMIADIQQ